MPLLLVNNMLITPPVLLQRQRQIMKLQRAVELFGLAVDVHIRKSVNQIYFMLVFAEVFSFSVWNQTLGVWYSAVLINTWENSRVCETRVVQHKDAHRKA
jgi:hypothetical protein